jgi:tRNA pseudouridine65 synthase
MFSSLPPNGNLSALPEQLPILFKDDSLVVVNKPSGLLVHRSLIDRHERRFAVQMLRDQLGQRVYPVHRLDKGTSGALVFALDRDTARLLANDFSRRRVGKTYLAVVRGWPAECGDIDHPLDAIEMRSSCRARPSPSLAHAFSHGATVELPRRVDRYPRRATRWSNYVGNGRRHQLRRHLAHASHPIVGDSTYGKGRHNRLFAELFGVQRLLLACVRLEFAHPVTRQPVTIDAPLAADFASVLQRLGWNWAPSPAEISSSSPSPSP